MKDKPDKVIQPKDMYFHSEELPAVSVSKTKVVADMTTSYLEVSVKDHSLDHAVEKLREILHLVGEDK